jgi:hypothetical protein
MRRITVIGMIILGLVALPLMAAAKSDKTPDKIEICHVDEDGETRTIEVSEKAKAAHLKHGDALEACPEASTTEPPVTASFVGAVTCGTGFYQLYCDLALDSGGSTGAIDTYEWAYATGAQSGVSDEPNPTFLGLFKNTTAEVTLTVTSTGGASASVTQSILIVEPITP